MFRWYCRKFAGLSMWNIHNKCVEVLPETYMCNITLVKISEIQNMRNYIDILATFEHFFHNLLSYLKFDEIALRCARIVAKVLKIRRWSETMYRCISQTSKCYKMSTLSIYCSIVLAKIGVDKAENGSRKALKTGTLPKAPVVIRTAQLAAHLSSLTSPSTPRQRCGDRPTQS